MKILLTFVFVTMCNHVFCASISKIDRNKKQPNQKNFKNIRNKRRIQSAFIGESYPRFGYQYGQDNLWNDFQTGYPFEAGVYYNYPQFQTEYPYQLGTDQIYPLKYRPGSSYGDFGVSQKFPVDYQPDFSTWGQQGSAYQPGLQSEYKPVSFPSSPGFSQSGYRPSVINVTPNYPAFSSPSQRAFDYKPNTYNRGFDINPSTIRTNTYDRGFDVNPSTIRPNTYDRGFNINPSTIRPNTFDIRPAVPQRPINRPLSTNAGNSGGVLPEPNLSWQIPNRQF